MEKKANCMKYFNKFPDIVELHTSVDTINKWINYGCLDSEMTFYLYYLLQ